MFRVEAIEARKRKLHGDVFLAQPVSFSLISAVLGLFLVLIATLIITGTYSRTEYALGYIAPTKGLVKIQASQFGTIETVNVSEGDEVRVGQVLLTIATATTLRDGSSNIEKSLQTLVQQRSMLHTQVTLEQNKLEAELTALRSEITEAELQIKSLQDQLAIQRKITASAETSYKKVQGILDKGYISEVESERRLQTWLGHQAQEQIKAHELVGASARLEQLSIRLEKLPIESRQRVSRLHAQLSELGGRELDQRGRQAYSIASPINGRVTSIRNASEGRTIQVGYQLLTILPSNSDYQAELFVPSRAVGFIEEGQEVRLRYDAFPYQRFGSYPAKIKSLTETILSPEEVIAPFEVSGPVYRVTAALEEAEVLAEGKSIPLQNGMTLQANIILERRGFLDWILEPIRGIQNAS